MYGRIRDLFQAKHSSKSLRRSETSVPDLGLRRSQEHRQILETQTLEALLLLDTFDP